MPEPLRSDDDGQTFGFLDPKVTEALFGCRGLSSTSRRLKSFWRSDPLRRDCSGSSSVSQ